MRVLLSRCAEWLPHSAAMQATVVEAGKIAARSLLELLINGRHDAAVAALTFSQLCAPGVDDHAVTIGLAAGDVEPTLGCGNYIA